MRVSVAFLLVAVSYLASSSAFFLKGSQKQAHQQVPQHGSPQGPMQPHETYYYCRCFTLIKIRFQHHFVQKPCAERDFMLRCIMADFVINLKALAAHMRCEVVDILLKLGYTRQQCKDMDGMIKSGSVYNVHINICTSFLQTMCNGLTVFIKATLGKFLGHLLHSALNLELSVGHLFKLSLTISVGNGHGKGGLLGGLVGGVLNTAGGLVNTATGLTGNLVHTAGDLTKHAVNTAGNFAGGAVNTAAGVAGGAVHTAAGLGDFGGAVTGGWGAGHGGAGSGKFPHQEGSWGGSAGGHGYDVHGEWEGSEKTWSSGGQGKTTYIQQVSGSGVYGTGK